MKPHLFFLSIPGLRLRDLDASNTPTLYGWANRGAIAEMVPTFPCVTSSVQASMFTGSPPIKHGITANGFYYRERHTVEMWTGWNQLVQGPQIWEALRAQGLTSAVWHAQNIKGADADFIVTPAPIHESDGTTKLWCYSKPTGLYQQLLDEFGHFPLQHYWGPLSNIESTRWILRAAAWLHETHAPNLQCIYVPHLDYAMQKFGPNGPQAKAALAELDRELAVFAQRITSSRSARDVVFFIAGEYALTDVAGVIYPNRILREAGLLRSSPTKSCERDSDLSAAGRRGATDEVAEYLDFSSSDAFALVDHQLAHIYITKSPNPHAAESIAGLFRSIPGIQGVFVGEDRAKIGMTHERCGDVVVVSDDSHWLAYYWWLDDAKAPPFARTVDIHNKPGYDPVELFFDPKTRGIPLDASLVRGSHGVPATGSQHRTALICSRPLGDIQLSKVQSDIGVFHLIRHYFTC